MSEGEASGTKGNNPSPYNLLIEGPPPEEAKPSSGEEEQNSSRSSFRSLASVFASPADRKSNHGFAELSGRAPRVDEEEKRSSNCERTRASEKMWRAPHYGDIDPVLIHERQLLGPIPILWTKRRSGSLSTSFRDIETLSLDEKYLRTDRPSSGGLIIQDHQPVFLSARFARHWSREYPRGDGSRAQERRITW